LGKKYVFRKLVVEKIKNGWEAKSYLIGLKTFPLPHPFRVVFVEGCNGIADINGERVSFNVDISNPYQDLPDIQLLNNEYMRVQAIAFCPKIKIRYGDFSKKYMWLTVPPSNPYPCDNPDPNPQPYRFNSLPMRRTPPATQYASYKPSRPHYFLAVVTIGIFIFLFVKGLFTS
jgi:hypothetical protein